MHLDETSLLRRARGAYELGRLRDALTTVGWVVPATVVVGCAHGWSRSLAMVLAAAVAWVAVLWGGQLAFARPSPRLAPLLLLLVIYWPFASSC